MPYSDPLPEVFAIQRRTNTTRVFFQVLKTQYNRLQDYFTVSEYTSTNRPTYVLDKQERSEFLYEFTSKVNVKDVFTDTLLEVNYWRLPYTIRNPGMTPIPILEFQCRSWIPTTSSNYLSIQMPYGSNEFLQTTDSIQHKRLETIRINEDKYDNRSRLQEREERRWELADLSGRYSIRREPEFHMETTTVERVVVKPLILPKAVGDILLSSARKGEDSCPISATPFATCERLCVTSCFHIFENESLAKWNETNSNCPVCRSAIENIVSEDKK